MHLGQDFGQWNQADEGRHTRRLLTRRTVRQLLDAVHDADGDLFAAHGASPLVRPRRGRFPADVAFAMTVEMVFALFREEFQRALERGGVARLQGAEKGRVGEFGVEKGGLARQFLRRMGV